MDEIIVHDDDHEEPIDPRIGEKLEELNSWTGRINKLEQQFEEENGAFRAILTEYSDKLKSLSSRIGIKYINEAREYYETKEKSRQAQVECQKTVMAYEKSCQLLLQAKDEIERTENKFANGCVHHEDTGSPGQRDSGIVDSIERQISELDCSEPLTSVNNSPKSETKCPSPPCPSSFDCTWQEVLNQSIIKLREAESLKQTSKVDHERSMKAFMDLEEELSVLEKKYKTSIKKSQTYFNESFKFKSNLIKKKEEIEFLNEQIIASKSYYAIDTS